MSKEMSETVVFDKEKYLKSHGTLCPYCESADIISGDQDFTEHLMFQNVKCSHCEKEWTDIYTLTDVNEVE